jgi:hypothetical protein
MKEPELPCWSFDFKKNNSGWELGGSFSKNQRTTSPSYFENPKKILVSENQG